MKKLLTILLMGTLVFGSAFAMDLSVGLKGIVGADNSDVDGVSVGGGFDINLDIKNGFGLQIESNIVPSKITSTDDGVTFTNNMAVNIPIIRPVIGMDKTEIVKISQQIGTFETSILPYEDCCSIFAPKHPLTKPRLEGILKSESSLDVEGLIEKVMETVEIS